ncbi:MAG: hypothetical protein II837_10745 [Treponema sp.]|nr:hypothetical protein [Treponema sp.]
MRMKKLFKKLISFLLFLIIGIAINLFLGLCIGTVFYFLRDKELAAALGGIYFIEYFWYFYLGLGVIGWIVSLTIMRKSLFEGLGFVFLPVEIIIVLFSLLMAYGGFVMGFETICIYDLLIDTEYSESFNPYNIQNLEVGMSRDEVIALVGAPLDERNNTIYYTHDGKCPFGDFAWYELSLELEDDKVIGITSHWMHD